MKLFENGIHASLKRHHAEQIGKESSGTGASLRTLRNGDVHSSIPDPYRKHSPAQHTSDYRAQVQNHFPFLNDKTEFSKSTRKIFIQNTCSLFLRDIFDFSKRKECGPFNGGCSSASGAADREPESEEA